MRRSPHRSGTGIRLVILAVAVLVLVALALFPELRDLERLGLRELLEMGPWAPVALVAAYCVASVLLLPAFALDMAAGAHFGFWQGVLWVQLAAAGASVSGYLAGRFLFRRFLERLMERRPSLGRLDQAVQEEGWKVVLLTRLSPVLAFSLLNALYGALRVPLRQYLPATFVGMLPGTALYVYLGLIAGDLSGAPGRAEPLPHMWAVEIGGLVLTGVIVVALTRRAQRILSRKLRGDATVGGPTHGIE